MLNEARASNIKTTRTFQDFKLHIEVLCPEHCNSGIYLRGRHEIQVGPKEAPVRLMNGRDLRLRAPKVDMPLGSGTGKL